MHIFVISDHVTLATGSWVSIRVGNTARLNELDILHKKLVVPFDLLFGFSTDSSCNIEPSVRCVSVIPCQSLLKGFVLLCSPWSRAMGRHGSHDNSIKIRKKGLKRLQGKEWQCVWQKRGQWVVFIRRIEKVDRWGKSNWAMRNVITFKRHFNDLSPYKPWDLVTTKDATTLGNGESVSSQDLFPLLQVLF